MALASGSEEAAWEERLVQGEALVGKCAGERVDRWRRSFRGKYKGRQDGDFGQEEGMEV